MYLCIYVMFSRETQIQIVTCVYISFFQLVSVTLSMALKIIISLEFNVYLLSGNVNGISSGTLQLKGNIATLKEGQRISQWYSGIVRILMNVLERCLKWVSLRLNAHKNLTLHVLKQRGDIMICSQTFQKYFALK